MATTYIYVRDARDRLLDLLGIGQTYPLRDLAVRDEQLTVAFNTSAKIPIEPSQMGVLYQLHDKDNKLVERTEERETGSVRVPVEAPGNGDRAILETPRIQEDVTFTIYARKLQSGREAYLRETATVKVGLDTTLQAWIRNVPPLNPAIEHPTPTDPRIIQYGGHVDVEIQNSQEGVDYRLVSFKDAGPGQDPEEIELSGLFLFQTQAEFSKELDKEEFPNGLRQVFEEKKVSLSSSVTVAVEGENKTWMITDRDGDKTYIVRRRADQLDISSAAVVRGDLGNIVLHTEVVFEDTDIRVRAMKIFDPSENRRTQTALLDIVLPLKVRANPALHVSVEPAIVDFNQQATIKLTDTQRSVRYQVYIRKIPDRDFVHTTIPASQVFTVSVARKPDVQVRKPQRGETWMTPDGYTARGEAQPGSGGEIRFTIPNLTDDSIAVVQAQKEHQATSAVPSAVQLEQAAVILVRPNPAPPLRLQALPRTAPTNGAVQVSGGQPGVFYSFRVDPNEDDIGVPVYFHKKDDDDQTINKGMGQLGLEVDFVIARNLSTEKMRAFPGLAQTPPEPPVLETRSLQSGTPLYVRAVKAQTGVAVELNQPVRVEPDTST